jgi:hypothetical protein
MGVYMVSFAGINGLSEIVNNLEAVLHSNNKKNHDEVEIGVNPLLTEAGRKEIEASKVHSMTTAEWFEHEKNKKEKEESREYDVRNGEEIAREAAGVPTKGVDWDNILPDYYRNLDHDGFNKAKDRLDNAVAAGNKIIDSVLEDPNLNKDQKEKIENAREEANKELNAKLAEKLKLTEEELKEFEKMSEEKRKEFLGERGANAINAYADLQEEKNKSLEKAADHIKNAKTTEDREHAVDEVVSIIRENAQAQESLIVIAAKDLEVVQGIKKDGIEILVNNNNNIEVLATNSNFEEVKIKLNPEMVEKNADGTISLKEGISFKDAAAIITIDGVEQKKDDFFKEQSEKVAMQKPELDNSIVSAFAGAKLGQEPDLADQFKLSVGDNNKAVSNERTV